MGISYCNPRDTGCSSRICDLRVGGGRRNPAGECPYDLADNGLWRVNAFGWPRAWYDELPPILSLPESILFAERDGDPVGFLHWWPNVYPLLPAGGRRVLYSDEDEAQGLPAAIGEGKIFKCAVGRNGERERERIERVMILEGARVMREGFGLRKVQVGNIPGQREELLAFLAAQGAGQIQELCVMRKNAAEFPEARPRAIARRAR